jgi:Flp pilus assembly protein TadB
MAILAKRVARRNASSQSGTKSSGSSGRSVRVGRATTSSNAANAATTLAAIERREFEMSCGNAIPYGQRFGLLALGSLMALTLVSVSIVGRSAAITTGLAVAWAVVVLVLWRIRWTSTFTRKRTRKRAK